MNEELKEKILEKSISLKFYGINDLAWRKEDAIHLIYSIMNDNLGILGGDVYRLDINTLMPLYENWSCEPNENESEVDYFLRSKLESLSFIDNFMVNSEENIVFSITFTDQSID